METGEVKGVEIAPLLVKQAQLDADPMYEGVRIVFQEGRSRDARPTPEEIAKFARYCELFKQKTVADPMACVLQRIGDLETRANDHPDLPLLVESLQGLQASGVLEKTESNTDPRHMREFKVLHITSELALVRDKLAARPEWRKWIDARVKVEGNGPERVKVQTAMETGGCAPEKVEARLTQFDEQHRARVESLPLLKEAVDSLPDVRHLHQAERVLRKLIDLCELKPALADLDGLRSVQTVAGTQRGHSFEEVVEDALVGYICRCMDIARERVRVWRGPRLVDFAPKRPAMIGEVDFVVFDDTDPVPTILAIAECKSNAMAMGAAMDQWTANLTTMASPTCTLGVQQGSHAVKAGCFRLFQSSDAGSSSSSSSTKGDEDMPVPVSALARFFIVAGAPKSNSLVGLDLQAFQLLIQSLWYRPTGFQMHEEGYERLLIKLWQATPRYSVTGLAAKFASLGLADHLCLAHVPPTPT